jgi:hypothetical protein
VRAFGKCTPDSQPTVVRDSTCQHLIHGIEPSGMCNLRVAGSGRNIIADTEGSRCIPRTTHVPKHRIAWNYGSSTQDGNMCWSIDKKDEHELNAVIASLYDM